MSQINAPRKVRFYAPGNMRAFDKLSEPTLEGVTGESYRDDDIASGGQALNLMDKKVRRFVKAFDNKVGNPQFKTDTIWTKDSGWTISPGKPGLAVYSGVASDRFITQAGVVVSSQTYIVIVKCVSYDSGTFTPKLGTASDGSVTGVGITVHEITANGTGFEFGVPAAAGAEFEYIYVLDKNDYRFDLALNSRMETSFAIIDGHNLLDVFPASLLRSMKMYHNSVDAFGSATEIIPSTVMAGLLGRDVPSIDLDGVDDAGSSPSDASVNFDRTDPFSIIREFEVDIADAGLGIFTKGTIGSFGYYMSTADGTQFRLGLGDDLGNRVIMDFTPSGNYTGIKRRIGFSYDGSGITDGIKGYENGVPVALEVAAGDTLSGDMTTATALSVGRDSAGKFMQGKDYGGAIYNRVLTDAEFLADFNGEQIDGGNEGNQTDLITDGDMSNAGSWTAAGTWDVNGAVAGQARVTGNSSNNNLSQAIVGTVNQRWRLKYDVKANSLAGSGALRLLGSSNDIVDNTINLVRTVGDNHILEFDGATSGDVTRFLLQLSSAYTGGVLDLDNVSLIPIGVVARYTGAGLSESQGKWFDDTANGNDMVLTGVEYRNTPNPNNLGFYLIKFDSVLNDLYWSLSINEDNDLPLALQKFGHLFQGKIYEFELTASEPFGGALGFPGVDSFETQSGAFDVTKRYGSRDSFVLPLGFMGDSTWNDLQELVSTISGRELPFYMEVVPLNAGERSIFYRIRLQDNEVPYSYVFGNDVPWRVGLPVSVDL